MRRPRQVADKRRELDRRRTPAELAAISQDQADALRGVIEAVLDGIRLTEQQRERAVEIAVAEVRRVAADEPR
jgi:ABC-type nitrate/sulfonate/bicarbonate transport system substrate-binding protein